MLNRDELARRDEEAIDYWLDRPIDEDYEQWSSTKPCLCPLCGNSTVASFYEEGYEYMACKTPSCFWTVQVS